MQKQLSPSQLAIERLLSQIEALGGSSGNSSQLEQIRTVLGREVDQGKNQNADTTQLAEVMEM